MSQSFFATCFLWTMMAAPARSEPVTVPFELLLTKHIAVQVKINGKGPYRVIFDTGAPVSLINSKTAKETGLLPKNATSSLFNFFGPVEQTTIRTLEIGGLEARAVPVIVMDHPTVDMMSRLLGPIEGVIGFPFFARYQMTLDYQTKRLTFAPSSFEPADILQTLLTDIMGRDKPATKVLAPAALWGFTVDKQKPDQDSGVTITHVLPGGAAATAGLRVGDRLLSLDGRWTDSVADCYAAAGYVKPGTEVRLVIERQGKETELRARPLPGL
jgi:membrane-associated protease RseP (regulator of RpoE activity)